MELSYAFSVEMISGAEESALKFSAAPTSGYGMELEGELELPDPMIMMTALYGFGPQRDAPTELLHGTLEARDAFDGATCARYTLTLTGDGILRAEDALRGGRWEMNLIPTEAEMLSVASASWLDDLVALIVRNASALEEGRYGAPEPSRSGHALRARAVQPGFRRGDGTAGHRPRAA